MTTNARDEKWSSWIDWNGGKCPIPDGTQCEVALRDKSIHRDLPANKNTDRCPDASSAFWEHSGTAGDIIAYRYKIKEPESDMHPDLEWLATNVSEWQANTNYGAAVYGRRKSGWAFLPRPASLPWEFSFDQWLQARKDLGMIMSDEEEEIEADDWGASIPEGVQVFQHGHKLDPKAVDDLWLAQVSSERMNEESVKVDPSFFWKDNKYSAYFKDVRHIDTLDVYRVVSLFDCEKHGHPISHAAKKLLLSGSRTGGKDVESDVREAIDTLHRWLEMREEDKNAL